MARRKTPTTKPASQRMRDAGLTPARLDSAIAETAAERGLSGHDAELLAMEAWSEYE